ncbi:MAG: sodium:calcium antiporter [Planctomycetota bacterium]|nr:MAG: sodium:calcium antiporter [Planctomycetota bacterium]
MDIVLLLLGISLLVGGGHWLVKGASELARALGVSPLVIGLTVVAFGTSAPELAVNVSAALQGRGEISFGNVIGSNLANIGLILGVTALFKPLPVQGCLIRRELPLMLLATAAVVSLALDPWLRGESAYFDRGDGVVLLLFFAVFIYATASEVLRGRSTDPMLAQSLDEAGDAPEPTPDGASLWGAAGAGLAGLLALLAGGRVTVDAASEIARAAGVSEAVIGLTVVAVGTSLPELVASVVATAKGAPDIAIGNVVGSNLFNLLFVLGITASVRPVEVPADGLPDLMALAVLSALMLPLALTYQRRVVRREGALLLALWAGYTLWRCTAGAGAAVVGA